MKEKSNFLSKLKYEKTALIVFILSVLAGGINYIFQILTGRFFDTNLFGEISVLLSVTGIFASIGSSLMKSVAVEVTTQEKDKIGGTIFGVSKVIFTNMPVIFTVMSVATYFMIDSASNAFAFLVAAFFICLSFCLEGVLQATGKIVQAELCEVIVSLSKITILLLLLFIGIGSIAVPLNSILSNILVFIFAYIILKKNDIRLNQSYDKNSIKRIFRHYSSSLLSTFMLSFFNSIDVLCVEWFFDESTVGMYSAASLFGKMILYIPQALVLVLIPAVAAEKDKEKSMKTLYKTLIYSVGLSAIAALGLFIIKKPLISILMGDKYLPCLQYFIPSITMMVPLVILTVLINYELAISDKKFLSVFSIISVLLSLISLALFHTSVPVCMYVLAAVYAVLSIAFFIRIKKLSR